MLDELLTLFDISWRFAWEGQITLNEPLIPMLVLVFVFSLFSLSLSLVRVRTLRDQFVSKCVRLSTLHENRMDSLRLSSLLSGAVWDPGGRCCSLYLRLCKDCFSLRELSTAPQISVVGVEMKQQFGNTSFQNICISLCFLTAWAPRPFQNTVTNLMIGILNATNEYDHRPITRDIQLVNYSQSVTGLEPTLIVFVTPIVSTSSFQFYD